MGKHEACAHLHGAHIDQLGVWACGQCFRLLDSRPCRYGQGEGPKGSRQDVIWIADIRKSPAGLTLNDFVRTIAKRLFAKSKGQMKLPEGTKLALAILEQIGDEWCDPAYDWSHAGAREFADEEMQNWDRAGGESNGQA